MAMDSTNAPQIIEHLRKSLNFTPHDTKWIPRSARLVCVGISPKSKGALQVYELSDGDAKTTLDTPAALPHGIKCATFGASSIEDRHITVGDYSGNLTICDLEVSSSCSTTTDNTDKPTPSLPTVFSTAAHEGIVNAVDGIGGSVVGHGAPEIVTGGRDGAVHVWDPRVDHSVRSFVAEENSSARDCWTVCFGNSFSDEERCVCAGYDNGDVKLFDMRTSTVRWEGNCRNGVTCVDFDRKDIEMNKMVVTTLESKFRCYDLRTRHDVDGFDFLSERAHRSTVWTARHSPQNRDIFMTGGGNGGFNIYKYHYPSKRVGKHEKDGAPVGVVGTVELLNSRVISTQPIVSFDWSPDREGLCCMSSLDQTMRVYIVTRLDKY